MNLSNQDKKELKTKIAHMLSHQIVDKAWLETLTIEELIAEISIYHQEVIHQQEELMRKALTTQIERETQRFKSLFESSPAIVAVVSLPEYRFREFNRTGLAMLGYSEEEVIGKTPEEIGLFVDFDALRQARRTTLQQGRLKSMEMDMRRKDGTILNGLGFGEIVDLQGEKYIINVMIDISDKKQIEAKLRESEKRYNLALESAGVGIWEWDYKTKEFYLSPLSKTMLGYAEHELGDNNEGWKSIRHPEDMPQIKQALQDHKDGKTEKHELILRFRHKSGEWRWILTKGGVLRDAEGKPHRLVGTHMDLTDLIREREKNEELERFFTFTPNLMCISDTRGNLHKVNNAWQRILGYSSETLVKGNFLDYLHSDDVQPTLEALVEVVRKNEISCFHNRYRCQDGSYRHMEWSAHLYGDLVYASARDITDRMNYERQLLVYQGILQEKNQLIEAILDHAPIGIWVSGEQGTSLLCNKYIADRMEAEKTMTAADLEGDQLALRSDQPLHFEKTVMFKGQTNHTLQVIKSKLSREDGSIIGVLGIALDITQRKKAEDALRVNEERLRMITDTMNDTIWVLNISQGQFTYVSPTVKQLTGYTPEEAMAQGLTGSFMLDSLASVIAQIEQASQDLQENPDSSKVYSNEVQQPTKNGGPIWVEYTARYRFNAQNEIEAVGVSRNIEERKKAEEEIIFLSQHDQLTKLFNRRYFDEKAEEEITRAGRYRQPLSLIMIDIDHFKRVNDTWGHPVGDHVLQQLAEEMSSLVRQSDVLARLGGEEFVLLLPETKGESAEVVAEKIRKSIDEKVFPTVGRITVSLGVAERRPSESFASWYKRTDAALYQAKKAGRNRVIQASD